MFYSDFHFFETESSGLLTKVTTRMTVPLETTEKILTNSGNREG